MHVRLMLIPDRYIVDEGCFWIERFMFYSDLPPVIHHAPVNTGGG